jgi:hypothetical protein
VSSAVINRQCFRPIFAALSLSLASCGSATDRTLEETFEQFYTIEPTANVTIKNGDGAVRIYGAGANEIRVQAIKRAYTPSRLKQIAVNVFVQPGSVSIETNSPKKQTWGLFDRSATVEYTIVVPQTANISRLELGNGEILVDGMHGQSVQARLGSGLVFDHNCFGNVEFSVGRGAVTLAYDWWEPGKFSIETEIAQGNVWAFLPSDAAFHLIAETLEGKIANDFEERGERAAQETTKVDTLIHGGGEVAIKVHVSEGNIKVVEKNP